VIHHEPYGPGEKETAATELHYRNAIDLIFIIEGGGDMMLGDGAHPVQVGDCVVMAGTSHGLRPGPHAADFRSCRTVWRSSCPEHRESR